MKERTLFYDAIGLLKSQYSKEPSIDSSDGFSTEIFLKFSITEKIKISKEALSLIAENSSGGMRDAISLLDQIQSFIGKEINCPHYVKVIKIKYVKKDEDPRDYRVTSEKIKKELGFTVSKTVPEGIKEIKEVLQLGVIVDPENSKYYNIPH